MNYLAHLFLAENTPDAQLGNLLGDFVKGPLMQYQTIYRPDVLRGIQIHRWIDQFTDRHPLHCQSRQRVAPTLRRFAGIAVDIYYDHFLACHWSCFSAQPREQFVAEIYTLLSTRQAELPPRLQAMLPYIIREDWLNGYQAQVSLQGTFMRLGHRIKRQHPLAQAPELLQQHYTALEADFLAFFPELIAHARSLHAST
ncbi:MAG: ACP phosphodiesterase [Cyanobacteria bacterium P01_G01_bin.54]